MIPLRDTVRSSTIPVVTYSLIATCTAVFLYEVWLGASADSFINKFSLIPSSVSRTVLHGTFPLTVSATLVTSLFLHGGWMHLLGNMLYLYIFGENVEDRIGRKGFILFYLLSGIGAGLAEVLSVPDSRTPLLGASGAIAGVLGAYFFALPPSPRADADPAVYPGSHCRDPGFLFSGDLVHSAVSGSGDCHNSRWRWGHCLVGSCGRVRR